MRGTGKERRQADGQDPRGVTQSTSSKAVKQFTQKAPTGGGRTCESCWDFVAAWSRLGCCFRAGGYAQRFCERCVGSGRCTRADNVHQGRRTGRQGTASERGWEGSICIF